MSADLFAAFGVPQSNEEGVRRISSVGPSMKNSEPKSIDVSTHHPWILQSQPMPKPQRQMQTQPLWKQDYKGADVLFDASDNEEEEDDFGDFEAPPVEAKEQLMATAQHDQDSHTDLLGLDDFSEMQIQHKNKSPPGYGSREVSLNDFFGQITATQRSQQLTQSHQLDDNATWFQSVVPPPSQTIVKAPGPIREAVAHEEDDWGNFEDVKTPNNQPMQPQHPTTTNSVNAPSKSPTSRFPDEEWEAFKDGPPAHIAPLHPATPAVVPSTSKLSHTPTTTQTIPISTTKSPSRPTNIPPPSTLLQLLPRIFATLTQQSRLPQTPSTLAQQVLQAYITTARLISGRQHRWKRDTLLSQSTRISQAGIKNTGMKLTALDKSETVKEEQEAQEAVAAWGRNAAVLNAVMLKGKVSKPSMSLSASMAVRSGSGLGVLSARECCALCGLKRNERVNGIDVKVDDTFGEFWVEFWGHRDCCEFWYNYEGLLIKR